jgi:thiosulfate/3-mercaptopyruvate sulfurtransferase
VALLALTGCGGKEAPPLAASPATDAYPDNDLLAGARWVAERIDDPTLRLIDCSPLADYQRGHLPHSVHVWWQDTIEIHNQIYGMQTGIPNRERIFRDTGLTAGSTVVCYDNSGGAYAARVIWMLYGSSFRNARLLDGGASAWVSSGLELTTGSPDVPAGNLTAIPDEEVLAHAETLLAELGRVDRVVLDTRTERERRETWFDRLRRGTIPGARWLPRDAFLTGGDTPVLQPPDELRRRLAAARVPLDTPEIVVFGLHGTLAALPWLALRALGAPHVRVYDGSWAEWGSNDQWPIEPLNAATS